MKTETPPLDLEAIRNRPIRTPTEDGLLNLIRQWNADRECLIYEVERLRKKIETVKKEAVQQFCEEVAAQQLRFMESRTFDAMGQFTPEYAQAAAFQLIRDTTISNNVEALR